MDGPWWNRLTVGMFTSQGPGMSRPKMSNLDLEQFPFLSRIQDKRRPTGTRISSGEAALLVQSGALGLQTDPSAREARMRSKSFLRTAPSNQLPPSQVRGRRSRRRARRSWSRSAGVKDFTDCALERRRNHISLPVPRMWWWTNLHAHSTHSPTSNIAPAYHAVPSYRFGSSIFALRWLKIFALSGCSGWMVNSTW
jgi:hypothetical protein